MKTKYYCEDCGVEVNEKRAERCRSCARKKVWKENRAQMIESLRNKKYSDKGMEWLKKFSKLRIGKTPPNKGIKNSTGHRLVEITKNTIIKHHIDGNKKNNKPENFLRIENGLHRSLHWKGYEYLVRNNLLEDYLKEFSNRCNEDYLMKDGKVVHHIDCNRENNKKDNLIYLSDRAIHNKLHQEAYLYLVEIGKIKKYLDWFLSLSSKERR